MPRSRNPIPEPATRSLTVLETSTSPGAAWAATRAPMWTAMPPTFPSISSHSPVWRPARTSMPSSHAIRDRAGAADRPSGAVEAGEESVPGRVELLPAEAGELGADVGVVGGDQRAPAPVAQLGGLLRRADDV